MLLQMCSTVIKFIHIVVAPMMLSTNSKKSIHLSMRAYIISFCRQSCLLSMSSRACNMLHVYCSARKEDRGTKKKCSFACSCGCTKLTWYNTMRRSIFTWTQLTFVMGSGLDEQIAANRLFNFKNVVHVGNEVLNNLDNITSVIDLYMQKHCKSQIVTRCYICKCSVE